MEYISQSDQTVMIRKILEVQNHAEKTQILHLSVRGCLCSHREV